MRARAPKRGRRGEWETGETVTKTGRKRENERGREKERTSSSGRVCQAVHVIKQHNFSCPLGRHVPVFQSSVVLRPFS